MTEVALRTRSLSRASSRELAPRTFAAAVGATAGAVAAVLAVFIHAWPPHEDEALALFVGRESLPQMLHTVIAQRGGAPLHFLLAWTVVHLGGGLIALRAVSVLFAVASIPVVAVLASRLADRTTGLVATVLASGTWVFLFHGIYGRMYSLFLFTSALSFIALLDAVERGGRRRFVLWGLALLATLASHPYAALVLAAQALYVLLRGERRRAALGTVAAVVVAATPFWWADVVLRDRMGIGVGGGGSRLGSPRAVGSYLWSVAGDFSAGPHTWLPPVLALAAAGFVLLARQRRPAALLTACVIAVPALTLMVARLNWTVSPQSRHLIFALPFFAALLATPLVELARLRPPLTAVVAAGAICVLVVGEVRWADRKTPPLFHGEPVAQQHARAQAAAWLADGGRADDVLLGYEPLYVTAWQRNRSFSHYALPRADPKLLAAGLHSLPKPLGRGVWVFDASDTTNLVRRQSVPLVVPPPARAFEARTFGPYLVIRSRSPLRTAARYLAVSKRVMRVGRALGIGDADINLHTLLLASKAF